MSCIVLASRKGGVGKTTTAIALAVMYARHGYKTGVLELDPNQPIADFAAVQEKKGLEEPNLYFLPEPDPNVLLKTTMKRHAKEHDVLIVDLPGVASDNMLNAAAMADLVLIPMATTRWDANQAYQTYQDMVEIVADTKHPPALRVLLTQTPPTTTALPNAYKQIREILKRLDVPLMRVEMTRRQPWVDIQEGGTFPEADEPNSRRANAYHNALALYQNTLEYLVVEDEMEAVS